MTDRPNDHEAREQMADVLRETLDAYFNQVDPEDADTDDMAWALVRALERTGQ